MRYKQTACEQIRDEMRGWQAAEFALIITLNDDIDVWRGHPPLFGWIPVRDNTVGF